MLDFNHGECFDVDVGAASLERMEARFGARFMPVWGCTEASGVALANGPGEDRKPGATGRPVGLLTQYLVDRTDSE